jgi:hypothetical protein
MIDVLQLRATDRVDSTTLRMEDKVEVGFAEMRGQFEHIRKEIYTIAAQKRAEERMGAAKSLLSLSTYAGDEKAVWQDFRRVLIEKGFWSRTLEIYREVLEAHMLRLDQSGLLDQKTVPASSLANGTPWWPKRMHMDTVQSLSGYKWTKLHRHELNPPILMPNRYYLMLGKTRKLQSGFQTAK